MPKIKASFSRKPTVTGIKIAGSFSSKLCSTSTPSDVKAILDAVVAAIDGCQAPGEVEQLTVTLG